MMYTLEDIWEQSVNDPCSVNLDADGYESRAMNGIKIIKDSKTNVITMLSSYSGGNFYSSLGDDVKYFESGGWRYGIYVVSLSNLRSKLGLVMDSYKEALHSNVRQKQINLYKSQIDNISKKIAEFEKKLNQLNQM